MDDQQNRDGSQAFMSKHSKTKNFNNKKLKILDLKML